MKGFSSIRVALKVDVLKDGKIQFSAGASVYLSAREFYRLGQ